MIYLGLAALALVAVALVLSDGSDSVGGVIGPDQLANLAWTGTILLLVVAGFWRQFTARLGANLQALLAWGLIGLALVIGYSYRDRIQDVGARVLGDLRPGSATPGADGSVTVTRRADGDFRVDAEVNGRVQPFLFDTGASSVVLTAENAAALGSPPRPPISPPASPPPTASPTRRRPSSTRSASARSPSGGSTPWWPSPARSPRTSSARPSCRGCPATRCGATA